MTNYWEDNYSNLIHEIFHALWSNGYEEYVFQIRDYVKNADYDEKYPQVTCPDFVFPADDTPEQDRDTIQVFWSMLVNMFGCCGVSERSGWLEEIDEALDYIEYGIQCADLDIDWSECVMLGTDISVVDDPHQEYRHLCFDDWKTAKKNL